MFDRKIMSKIKLGLNGVFPFNLTLCLSNPCEDIYAFGYLINFLTKLITRNTLGIQA